MKGLSLMLYKLKFFIFRNFAMILGDEQMNLPIRILIGIIELFQLISFAFREQFTEIWKNPEIQGALHKNILDNFNLYGLTRQSENYGLLIVFFYTGVALVTITILNMVYLDYSQNKETDSTQKQENKGGIAVLLLKGFCDIFPDILFQPFMYCTLILLNCN